MQTELIILIYIISVVGTYYYYRYVEKELNNSDWNWVDIFLMLGFCIILFPLILLVTIVKHLLYLAAKSNISKPPRWL